MKIGRNDRCPCGSGKKFKRCCINKQVGKAPGPAGPGNAAPPSLRGEIKKIQLAAGGKEIKLRELGVFVLFSTARGDAWLLEVSAADGVQVASMGEPIEVDIEENPETIAVNWTHTFAFRNKQFVVTSYKDRTETVCPDYPSHTVFAAVNRIRRRISPDLLDNLYRDEQ